MCHIKLMCAEVHTTDLNFAVRSELSAFDLLGSYNFIFLEGD